MAFGDVAIVRLGTLTIVLTAVLAVPAAHADDAAEFYKGRTLVP